MADGILNIFPFAERTGETQGRTHLVYSAVALDAKVSLADAAAAHQTGIALVSGFGI
jgi:hypothetical protein